MNYLSVKEVALKWNTSERSVRNYCATGRVHGAFLTGKTWNIPENVAEGMKRLIVSYNNKENKILEDDIKMFYYRDLKEWDREKVILPTPVFSLRISSSSI